MCSHKNHPSRGDINSNRKRYSLLSMEERPTKITKIDNNIEPESVEVNVLPPFPPMDFTLQELYTMINCAGVYDRIRCKDITNDEIPIRLYQNAITRTYDKFCKFCNDEFENWLSLNMTGPLKYRKTTDTLQIELPANS